jgi:hypothetical protein
VQPGREALTKFGIQLEDEGRHPFDPEVEWWNESWFWDWFDATGELAGHCRIGIHPNQGRAWLWLDLFRAGEWIALEEPRCPSPTARRRRSPTSASACLLGAEAARVRGCASRASAASSPVRAPA